MSAASENFPAPSDNEPELVGAVAETRGSGGTILAAGPRVETGPLDGAESELVAAALTRDPLAGNLSSPFGAFELLRLVGLTGGQLAAAKAGSTSDVVRKISETNPSLVTTP